MLTFTNTTVQEYVDATVVRHTVDGTVTLAGDSIWDYDYKNNGYDVRVTGITVIREDGYNSVNVTHNAGWQIYSDTGFAEAISRAVGFTVAFTEQGMQEDGMASLEEVS